jgi:hypothetical protein
MKKSNMKIREEDIVGPDETGSVTMKLDKGDTITRRNGTKITVSESQIRYIVRKMLSGS